MVAEGMMGLEYETSKGVLVREIKCYCCAAVSLRHVLHSVRRHVQPIVFILTMVYMHNAN